jgi:hypothetical protein
VMAMKAWQVRSVYYCLYTSVINNIYFIILLQQLEYIYFTRYRCQAQLMT